MNFEGKKIGFVITGSFCIFELVLKDIKDLIKKNIEIIPIMSFNSYDINTKYGKAKYYIDEIEKITNKKIIHTIEEAEKVGPKINTDIVIVLPCSGNTTSKLAYNIIDTPATMAVKSHLRNDKPVIIAIATNDGLGRQC